MGWSLSNPDPKLIIPDPDPANTVIPDPIGSGSTTLGEANRLYVRHCCRSGKIFSDLDLSIDFS